jgi:heat shock protein HslJ
MEIKMKRIFLIAIVVLALAACSPAKPDLSGEWILVSYGDSFSPTSALPDVDTSIKFENGQMNGNVGCNGFGGTYELSGDQITFSGIMSTMMYCEETSVQEQAVLGVFSDSVKLPIQLNSDTLMITSADGASIINLTRK